MRRTIIGNRKLLAWVAAGAVMLACSVAVAGYAISNAADSQQQTNRIVCLKLNRFSSVIVATLERSERNLPKLAYFQAHPAELVAQLSEVHRQIRLFQPQRCG